jgi:hypothetical protein
MRSPVDARALRVGRHLLCTHCYWAVNNGKGVDTVDEKKNREHNGGGEQNRRKQKGGDGRIEKNPPVSRDAANVPKAGEGASGESADRSTRDR